MNPLTPSRLAVTVGIAQMEVIPGDPARNAAHMLRTMEEARDLGVDILAFPEMCLPGYLLGDQWERPAFLRECELWAQGIVDATSRQAAGTAGAGGAEEGPGRDLGSAGRCGMAVIFGTVSVDWKAKGEDGRPRKYNSYVVAQDGKALLHPGLGRPYGIKALLPNYREFEEPRHFHDARKLAAEAGVPLSRYLEPFPLDFGEGTARRHCRTGILLCEDAWQEDYAQKPLDLLAAKGCDILLNLSCSPFTQGKNQKRNRVFAGQAKSMGFPIFYVNAVSLQNNGKTLFTFDGRGTAYGADGEVAFELPPYESLLFPVEVKGVGPRLPARLAGHPARAGRDRDPANPGLSPIAEIHQALRYGAQAYLKSFGMSKVVVGVSGGIDSAVAAALYADFLAPENLLLVNMPSRFNSSTTRDLAKDLAANLGCLYMEAGIQDSVVATMAQLDGLPARSVDGTRERRIAISELAFENVQARDRSSRILAALASGFGGVFTCNANKAELTSGWGTLYGDLTGYLAVLGDLWKGEVYALGRYLNAEVFRREAIPEGIFTIIPSAELSDRHAVDEGKGDPFVYPYHDRLFFAMVQRWNRASPEEILAWYLDGSLNSELGLEDADAYALFPDARSFVADLERWWEAFCGLGLAKRVQAPPILAVSSRSFGFDLRESLGKPIYTARYQEMKSKVLGAGGGFPGD